MTALRISSLPEITQRRPFSRVCSELFALVDPGFKEASVITDKVKFLFENPVPGCADTPLAVFRIYRIACNLTGRFNSPSANYVTFFGLRDYMRTVLIAADDIDPCRDFFVPE
jgi:hypothetical protein